MVGVQGPYKDVSPSPFFFWFRYTRDGRFQNLDDYTGLSKPRREEV